MRVIIAGSGLLGASVMEPLLESGHEVVGLIQNGRATPPAKRRSARLRALFAPPSISTPGLALRHGVPVLWLDAMNETELNPLRALDPDLIIACGFGIIFNKTLLDLPHIGCINVHSSLLPEHRGPSPFAHVILANRTASGVTFHVMDEDIDTGDILHQVTFPLTSMDTGLTVYHKASSAAGDHILEVVDDIEINALRGTPQDSSRATYDPRMTDDAAMIDWREPAEDIERLVRAAVAYYPAWFTHRRRLIRVTRATFDPRPVDGPAGRVLETSPYPVVATGQGRLIVHAAHITAPIPWSWPAPWSRLKAADLLY